MTAAAQSMLPFLAGAGQEVLKRPYLHLPFSRHEGDPTSIGIQRKVVFRKQLPLRLGIYLDVSRLAIINWEKPEFPPFSFPITAITSRLSGVNPTNRNPDNSGTEFGWTKS